MLKRELFLFALMSCFVASTGAVLAQSVAPAKILGVPYINQVLQKGWSGPWKEACEEASITMVDNYYRGVTTIDLKQAEKFMRNLFAYQNQKYGSNANSDAARSLDMLTRFSGFNARIVQDPTMQSIKDEIDAGRPVIALHFGKLLDNPGVLFARNGSYYHMTVVVGYDDAAQDFVVNDPGDPTHGQYHRYPYADYMDSLHDYDYARRKADGPPRVLFTYPKLAKAVGSPRIFYLQDGVRRYVTSPAALARHGLTWFVHTFKPERLMLFPEGEPLR
jgi:hypothetical protein